MLPIPGTSSLAHLNENVAVAMLKLSESNSTRWHGRCKGPAWCERQS
jgi:aryl-alcohol dehydrogenase-like predicted oxidoreductase